MKFTISIIGLLVATKMLVGQSSEGIATFYDDKFEGRPTANGEIFDQNKLTAAHRSLAFGTVVKVTNLQNKKSVVVTVTDRGPFVDSRLIDLSKSAASALGFIEQGLTKVRVEVVKPGESSTTATTNQSSGNVEPDATAQQTTQVKNELRFPNEYYELDIKFAQPVGFAIQVGSFTELANLMRMAQELRRIYGKNLLVQVTDVNERKVHRLMVGPFPERESAEKTLRNLKDDFTGSFVLELK
jgi:rare lipoprotein A